MKIFNKFIIRSAQAMLPKNPAGDTINHGLLAGFVVSWGKLITATRIFML